LTTVRRRNSLALSVWLLAAAPAFAQISPGPLAEAHESLNGAAGCRNCHSPQTETSQLCLDCHREIEWLIGESRGLHAGEDARNCVNCHPEHVGADFDLISFREGLPEQFDHARADWNLEGKHAETRCLACHKAEFRVSPVTRLSRRDDWTHSYLGLETTCGSCHRDVHQGSLGERCSECHAPTGWSAVETFDHARTGYPLTGKHAPLECSKCHTKSVSGTGAERFTGLNRDECSSCHEDVHGKRLGPQCSSCHTTETFRVRSSIDFNHDRTAFPLEGGHSDVKCEQCHRPQVASRDERMRPAHERCIDCHQDKHAGQFAGRGAEGDCSACHVVQGWKPSTFDLARHERIDFALRGKHAEAECGECHGPGREILLEAFPVSSGGEARQVFDLGDPQCANCHAGPHGSRFAATGVRPITQGCEACHGNDAFHPSTLDGALHATFGFRLDDGHAEVSCKKCHEEMRPRTLALPDPLVFARDDTCATCHDDPHGGQFAHRRDTGACDACHGGVRFRPAVRFDHNRSARFPLLRAHATIACERCHDRTSEEAGREIRIYSPISLDCRECHLRIAPNVKGQASRFGPAKPSN
jgi:hypothetical protein